MLSKNMSAMVGMKFGVNMLRFGLGLIFIILAVGAIDGPTGHEGDAWHLTFIFGALGLGFMLWALPSIADAD